MQRFDFVGGWFVRIGRRWLGLVQDFPFVVWVPVIAGGTAGMSAQGTFISTSDGASPPSFTELAEVVSIGGPNETSEELDLTHLRSPGAYREFLQSFKDGGELPLTLNFIPNNATQDSITGIRADYAANPQTVRDRRITYPDGTTCTFASFVKGVGSTASVGEKLALDVTLRISGATTWVEAP